MLTDGVTKQVPVSEAFPRRSTITVCLAVAIRDGRSGVTRRERRREQPVDWRAKHLRI